MKITKMQLRRIIAEAVLVATDLELVQGRMHHFADQTTPEMVARAMAMPRLGQRSAEILTDEFGISIGHALDICDAVKDYRRDNSGAGRSAAEARIDRLARTRDSSGRASARRMR